MQFQFHPQFLVLFYHINILGRKKKEKAIRIFLEKNTALHGANYSTDSTE